MLLAIEHGFPIWQAGGTLNRRVALTQLGRHDEGLKQFQEGVEAWRATGSNNAFPMYLGWFAEVSGRTGRTADAQSFLSEALTLVQTADKRRYEAELHRLKGEMLQIADGGSQIAAYTPETRFQKALDIARRQQAKW